MGDFRCELKIEMYLGGKIYKLDDNGKRTWWINYTPNEDGIDRRIVEWFASCWDDAQSEFNEKIAAIQKENDRAAQEERDLKEYERLKIKYGDKHKDIAQKSE